MKTAVAQTRLAIIGFSKLGQACTKAIANDVQLKLVGVVRQPQHVRQPVLVLASW